MTKLIEILYRKATVWPNKTNFETCWGMTKYFELFRQWITVMWAGMFTHLGNICQIDTASNGLTILGRNVFGSFRNVDPIVMGTLNVCSGYEWNVQIYRIKLLISMHISISLTSYFTTLLWPNHIVLVFHCIPNPLLTRI